jgi:hypothetical protein
MSDAIQKHQLSIAVWAVLIMPVVDDVLRRFFSFVLDNKSVGILYNQILYFIERKFWVFPVKVGVVFSVINDIQVIPFPRIIPEPDIIDSKFII